MGFDFCTSHCLSLLKWDLTGSVRLPRPRPGLPTPFIAYIDLECPLSISAGAVLRLPGLSQPSLLAGLEMVV